MQIEHHTIERDGYHWHVVTSGPVDAPPVLMLHCWTGNWTLWEKTMQHLDGQYRFIVPDHLGFGQSDKPRGQFYAIDQQAERSLHILKCFGYERATVIGHSMGGQIALTLAAIHPEAVERLIVVDPSVTGNLHWLLQLAGLWFVPVLRGITWPIVTGINLGLRFPSLGLHSMRMYFAEPFAQREAALYWAAQTIADGQVYSSAWAYKAIVAWDVTPLLSKISAPTLALWGLADYCTPISECDVLATHIRDFRAVRLSKVGHFPMIEAWEQYISQVQGGLT
ncbi:MAG: alpha/beta hydrolase [Chloroflexota bacterium]